MNKRVIIRIYKYYQNLNTCFKLGRCVSKIFKQISSQKRSLTLSLKAKGLINVSDPPRPIRAPKGQSDGTHRACAVLTQTGAFQLRCDVDRVTIKAKPWHGHTNNCRHHWTCKSNQNEKQVIRSNLCCYIAASVQLHAIRFSIRVLFD